MKAKIRLYIETSDGIELYSELGEVQKYRYKQYLNDFPYYTITYNKGKNIKEDDLFYFGLQEEAAINNYKGNYVIGSINGKRIYIDLKDLIFVLSMLDWSE